MAKDGSATVCEQTPHETEVTPHVNQTTRTATIINALKQRAQGVLNDKSIDPQSRAVIRYALEINDPWLARLVEHVEAGQSIRDTFDFSQIDESSQVESGDEKMEALADIICRAGEQSAAALLVLMGMLENSAHPKVLVNVVKHAALRTAAS